MAIKLLGGILGAPRSSGLLCLREKKCSVRGKMIVMQIGCDLFNLLIYSNTDLFELDACEAYK